MTQFDQAPETRLAVINRDRPLILFSSVAWSDYWQTRQHVAQGLSRRGWPLVFTSGVFTVWDVRGPGWRDAQWLARSETHSGVTVDWPGRMALSWPRRRAWDNFVHRTHMQQLARQVGWCGGKRSIACIFHPRFAPYLDHLADSTVVYYADDSFAKMPNAAPGTRADESRIVERADIIIATSAGVAANLPQSAASKLHLLPNGADVSAFQQGSQAPCPQTLADIPHPRICYSGSINEKVDVALIVAIAEQRPHWHWVLIGQRFPDRLLSEDTARHLRRCDELPNVHFIDPVPFDQLPAYVSRMDVNTMCYRTDGDGWWKDLSPLKLHEYLATGHPVVSANLESVSPFSDVVEIASDPDGWLDALARAIDGKGAGTPETRQAVARANSWDDRTERLEAILDASQTAP